MEYDLAVLSVSYLSLPEIDREKEDREAENVLLQGYFSFYEYAVSSWVFHLEAGIPGTITKDLLDQLAESLEVFLDLHWTSPSNTLVASKTMQEKLQPLREFDFHSKLTQAVVSTRKQLGRHRQGPSDDEARGISTITAQFRAVLEKLVSISLDPEKKSTLEKFYGLNWFKCPRINCQYFYKGFPSRNTVSGTWTGTSVLSCAFSKDVQRQPLAVLFQKSSRTRCPTTMTLTCLMVWSFQKSQPLQRQTKNILPRFSAYYARKSSPGNTT